MKITARGMIGPCEITVVAEEKKNGIEFLFNGRPDKTLETTLKLQLEEQEYIGNYKPDVYEDLNIYNVLENYYFDKLLEITDYDVSNLPYDADFEKKGGVY